MTDIVGALVKHRSELSGEAETLHTRLNQISTDLGHLDAVICQFAPDHDIASIRPKRPRREDAAKPGEMSRYVLGVLREAKGPLSTVEVAQRFMVDRGIDAEDRTGVRRPHGRPAGYEADRDDAEPSEGEGDRADGGRAGDDGFLGGGKIGC